MSKPNSTIKEVARLAGVSIGTVDSEGRPLAVHPQFAEEPDAMFVLWKDHTAISEAERINDLARSWGRRGLHEI